MTPVSTATARRIAGALEASPPRVPVVLGSCASGRTALLRQVHEQFGPDASQYVDLERVATTPERFYRAITERSPFEWDHVRPRTARAAFDAALAFLAGARSLTGEPAVFLLDEVLEVRTFESFPGLRRAFAELVGAFASSRNRFVLSTRYTARARRLLRDVSTQFLVIDAAPLSVEEVRAALPAHLPMAGPVEGEYLAYAVHALADGRPGYVEAVIDAMAAMAGEGGDPVSALTSLMAVGGRLATRLTFSYELRLHRARGYGALKAILEILAADEPLTLTQISHLLDRTPGSTKDYLSWLEDVDLVTSGKKRYRFSDPLLRLWVRLHCRTVPPPDEDVAFEVQQYALQRLPHVPAKEPAALGAGR